MIWFGSSAGVALCNMYPEARSVVQWLRYAGWIVLAYIVCFLGMLIISRWQPDTVPGQPLTHIASVEFAKPKRYGGDAR
jgi:hypothetical protein